MLKDREISVASVRFIKHLPCTICFRLNQAPHSWGFCLWDDG